MADARIVCICSYYDESPQWLSEHLASLASIVDDFVYVDGAYALFPGGLTNPASPLECAEAIESMGRAVGKTVLHYRPTQAFGGNEVEKRNMSLDLARTLPGVLGDPNVWFLVADADTVALKVNDAIPRILGQADGYNVASFGYQQSDHIDVFAGTPSDEVGFDRWHAVRRAEQAKKLHVRSIYRNVPGLAYGPAHWHVTYGLPGRERNWLWGGGGAKNKQPEPCLDLTYDLFFEHRRKHRRPGRNEDAARYYEIRNNYGIEDDNGVLAVRPDDAADDE